MESTPLTVYAVYFMLQFVRIQLVFVIRLIIGDVNLDYISLICYIIGVAIDTDLHKYYLLIVLFMGSHNFSKITLIIYFHAMFYIML